MSGRSMHSVLVGLVCLALPLLFLVQVLEAPTTIMCLESERQALLQFKQGLVDESNALASWKSKKDCCKWRGIACNNQTGHVTGLNFSFSYDSYFNYSEVPLRGAMSPSLLELPFVNYLDLSYNDFEGIVIPKLIGSLSQLKELKLAHANFSGLVPPQLGNLSNLHTLDLSGNYDAMPSFSPELRKLYLSNNKFSEPLSCFCATQAPYLGLIDISENQLSGELPDYWKQFQGLEALKLEKNKLSGKIPSSLGNLKRLTLLSLNANNFSGELPSLENCTNTTSIMASDDSFGLSSDEVGRCC
ncbi:receptor-like protein 19 [Rosa chinensis]|uniref:receptor-like protein 19 n=1 Tax=Rosa chinensis TaxID=74649 RepID=UPI000D08762A|nr:receptor-like protein 19 [Rosa chinensis]